MELSDDEYKEDTVRQPLFDIRGVLALSQKSDYGNLL